MKIRQMTAIQNPIWPREEPSRDLQQAGTDRKHISTVAVEAIPVGKSQLVVWHVTVSALNQHGELRPLAACKPKERRRARSLAEFLLEGAGVAGAETVRESEVAIHVFRPLTDVEVRRIDAAWIEEIQRPRAAKT